MVLVAALFVLVQAPAPAVSPATRDTDSVSDRLDARVRALEERLAEGNASASGSGAVDLGGDEYASIEGLATDTHVLARPWYENLHISGFVGAGYFETGDAGTQPDGGFEVRQAHLFVEAEVWDDTSVFVELRPVPHGRDDRGDDLTGEIYAHFRHLLGDGVTSDLGAKVGRFDIPFGEEYLWQDQTDNPLITPSAPFPYGFDEGVLLYGHVGGVHGVGAVMDGSNDRSVDEAGGVAVSGKLYGEPFDCLYLSGSGIINPQAAVSAFQFGGSYIYPVGWMMPSTLGASSAATVESQFVQADLVWKPFEGAELSSFAGIGRVEDRDETFSRVLEWLMIQPLVHITDDVYLALRYSTIRTRDEGEGFGLDGKFVSQGKKDFGYDAQSLNRFSAGIGWRANPHTLVKFEVGRDRYSLIEGSPFLADNDERDFIGLQVALSF